VLKSLFSGSFLGTGANIKRLVFLALLYFGLPLAGWHFIITARVAEAAQKLLLRYDDFAEVKFTHPWFGFGGSAGISKLSITPRDPENGTALTVDEVIVEGPGVGWLLSVLFPDNGSNRSGFAKTFRKKLAEKIAEKKGQQVTAEAEAPSSPAKLPYAKHVAITLKNFDPGFAGFLGDFEDAFGSASAAPFETAGCKGDAMWNGSELHAMGLEFANVQFRWEYTAIDSMDVEETSTLSAPGIGEAQITHKYRTPRADAFLFGDFDQYRVLEERYKVVDQGFVAARNAYCARRDRAKPGEFVSRHMLAMRRMLLSEGLSATAELEKIYRNYAERGGTLELIATPTSTVAFDKYDQYAVKDRFRMYNGVLRNGKDQASFDFEPATARAEPEDFAGNWYDLAELERSREAADSDAANVAMATTQIDPLSVDATRTPTPGTTASPALATTAPAKVPPIAVAPAPPPVASSTPPAPTSAASAAALEAAAFPEADTRLAYEALAQHVGKPVRIVSARAGARSGILESYTAKGVTLRYTASGGYAVISITRENVSDWQPLSR
jgi:hypothetical protein